MRRPFPFIAAAALALLCACQTPPEPPPVIVVAPPPEPPALILIPRQKALAAAFIDEAAVFHGVMTSAAGIDPAFASGEQVAEALRAGAGYEPRQLQRGAVAYVAVLALGLPEFADSFRAYSIDDAVRADLVRRLLERPDYAGAFPGGYKAAALAIGELDRLGGAAWRNGRAIQQAAYDVQRQPWAKEEVLGRDLRLEAVRTLSAQRLTADPAKAERLRVIAHAEPPISPIVTPLEPPYTGVIQRGLTLAAIAALGEAGPDKAETLAALLDEPIAADCLSYAKLMLLQCVAGSDRGHYEDVFCLGEHAISDTGRCMVAAAGSPNPSYTPPPPPPPPEPKAAPKAKGKAPARRPAARKR